MDKLFKTINLLKNKIFDYKIDGKIIASNLLSELMLDNITHMYQHICASCDEDYVDLYFVSDESNLTFRINPPDYNAVKKNIVKEIYRMETMYEACRKNLTKAYFGTKLYKRMSQFDEPDFSKMLFKTGDMVILKNDRSYIQPFNYIYGNFVYGKRECIYDEPRQVLDDLASTLNVVLLVPKYDDLDTAFYIAKIKHTRAVIDDKPLEILDI